MLKIERGIQVSERRVPMPKSRRGRKAIYPFEKMKVGDSFLAPVTGTDSRKIESKRCSIFNCARKHKPKRFITRVVNGGIRVWRVA